MPTSCWVLTSCMIQVSTLHPSALRDLHASEDHPQHP